MRQEWILPIMLFLPALLAGSSLLFRSSRKVLWFGAAGTLLSAGIAAVAVFKCFTAGSLQAAGGWLRMDALSAYHVFIMMTVFSLSALYSPIYFRQEIDEGLFSAGHAARYTAL